MDNNDDHEPDEESLFQRLAADGDADRDECPSPETLLALAEDTLVERDAAEAMAHVALCGPCRRGLAETRELLRLSLEVRALERAAIPLAAPVVEPARPTPRKQGWFSWRPGAAAFAMAAGAVAGLWFGYAGPEHRRAEQLASTLRQTRDSLAQANDAVRDAKEAAGRLTSTNRVQVARLDAAESALAEMPLPSADWALAGAEGRVRGGETPITAAPKVRFPVGEAVSETKPRLSYAPLPGAASHRVVLESLVDGSAPEVVADGANAVRPVAPLVAGARYRWSVLAFVDGRLVPSATAIFQVLGPDDRANVAAARSRLRGKPLALAVFLARTGLRAEARDVLRAIRPEDPAFKTARRWLATLE